MANGASDAAPPAAAGSDDAGIGTLSDGSRPATPAASKPPLPPVRRPFPVYLFHFRVS